MAPESNTIIADAQPRMAQLKAMSADIDAAVHDIIAAATPGVGLSKEDVTKIQSLYDKQADILTAHQQLALLCAAALDDSDTMQHLAASLTGAVEILKAETEAIAAVSARCAQIGAVCTAIDGIIAKLKAQTGTKDA